MKKIFAIGRAEYFEAIRSKVFLIGLFLMPVLMGGGIAMQVILQDQVDLDERRCAVVDNTGELFEILEARVAERNQSGTVWEEDPESGRVQRRPLFALEAYEPVPGVSAGVALSKRVKDGELQGYVILRPELIDLEGEVGDRPVSYHTDEPTFTELRDWLKGTINEEVRRRRFTAANLDDALVTKLGKDVGMWSGGLDQVREDGTVAEAEQENKLRTFGIPFGAIMLLFMIVMTSAPQLMNQVLEEKMQRISEVLVSAVSPFQLMMGKLLGTAGTSLTLAVVYLGGVFWATHHFGLQDMVPLSVYGWFLVMILFALFMYGAMFSALGAACSELRDAQSMVMPAMIVIMIPMFAFGPILESPNGSVAQALTFVPTATPIVLLLRLVAPPGPPAWEVLVGVGLCILSTVFFVWASGKVFRIGILSQGQAPSFRKLIGWVFSK